jgi:hypothetical protein
VNIDVTVARRVVITNNIEMVVLRVVLAMCINDSKRTVRIANRSRGRIAIMDIDIAVQPVAVAQTRTTVATKISEARVVTVESKSRRLDVSRVRIVRQRLPVSTPPPRISRRRRKGAGTASRSADRRKRTLRKAVGLRAISGNQFMKKRAKIEVGAATLTRLRHGETRIATVSTDNNGPNNYRRKTGLITGRRRRRSRRSKTGTAVAVRVKRRDKRKSRLSRTTVRIPRLIVAARTKVRKKRTEINVAQAVFAVVIRVVVGVHRLPASTSIAHKVLVAANVGRAVVAARVENLFPIETAELETVGEIALLDTLAVVTVIAVLVANNRTSESRSTDEQDDGKRLGDGRHSSECEA